MTLRQEIINKATRILAEEVEKKILLGDKKGPVFEEMAKQLSTVDGYTNLPIRITEGVKPDGLLTMEVGEIKREGSDCPHCGKIILNGSEIGIIAEVYYHLDCWQELKSKPSPLGGYVIMPQGRMPVLTPQEVVELENTNFLPKKETWRDRPSLL